MKHFITDNAKDAIIGVDLNGKISYCNPSCSKLLGYAEKQLTGKTYNSLLPRGSTHNFDQVRESILFNEDLQPIPTEFNSSNNTKVSVVAQYSPVRDESGRVIGLSVMLRRISTFEKAASKAQSLLETAPDAMVIVNQGGQIVLVNAQTENLFGYSKQELLGQDVEILIPDEFLKHHKKHRDKYFGQPKTRSMGQGMELYGKKKNGSKFPVEISLSPLKTEEGIFVSAAIRDITFRKKAENKFKGLLESAPDAVVIVGEDGKIQLVNTQVVNIFGFNKEELIGKKVEILIPERYRKSHHGHRHSFFTSPKMRPMGAGLELLGLRKNGEEFPVEISLSPLETEEGVLVSAAIRDITDRKQAEMDLEIFNQQLQTKNKELEQFAYVASHDLQEPLRTVTSFTELLAEEYSHLFDETGHKSIRFITEATGRMSELIKGLLDYGRIGLNRELKTVDCAILLNEIQNDLASVIAETDAKLESDALPKIQAYETEMRMLFQNLITNAIKFRKPGTAPRISVTSESVNEAWKFEVKDNGIGIPEEYKERIFVIYQRLHTRDQYEGIGMGLAHCQKIAELHGGTIWVDSQPGKGSTFSFTIPNSQHQISSHEA